MQGKGEICVEKCSKETLLFNTSLSVREIVAFRFGNISIHVLSVA